MKIILQISFVVSLFICPIKNFGNTKFVQPPDTFIYGQMQLTKLITDVGHSQSYDWLVTAAFFDKATHSTVPVGDLKYGTHSFKRNPYFGGVYFDTTTTYGPDSVREWRVLGESAIPDFSFTPTNQMPTYSDYSQTTGTISKINGVTISLTGISDATNITVIISDGENDVIESLTVDNSNTQSRLTNGATLNGNALIIPSGDLSVLQETDNAFINIIVSNIDYEVFAGKRVVFIKSFMYKRNKVLISN